MVGFGAVSSYFAWEKAYGDFCEELPGKAAAVCPNCGHDALRIAFVANERDRIGSAMFWCEFCLFGIHISRTRVPEGVDFLLRGTPWGEISKHVPEYTLVYPPVVDESPADSGFDE
ncbi:hypothetical protein [Amycolatopsis sp. NPDC059657]|uniref:hypothetical protein n=1 Tax=Amycolatopsis sp. NPDC059657 TaxID=3346899 RepID=UPI00366F9253